MSAWRQELGILVAMRIEGADDEGSHFADDLADTPRDIGLRSRNAAHAHRPVQAEIDAVERPCRLQAGDHPAEQGLVGFLRDPAEPVPVRGHSGDSMPTSSTPSHARATFTNPPM